MRRSVRHRPGLGRDAGFTLIELLIVVVIIGILAAIAIPIYNGVTSRANEEGTKSDLVNDKVAIMAYESSNAGNIPAAITDDVSGSVAANSATGAQAVDLIKAGWSRSSMTLALAYQQSGANGPNGVWCLSGTSASSATFHVSSNSKVTPGSCPSGSSVW